MTAALMSTRDGQARHSSGETIQRLLAVVRGRLGMEVAYLTEFVGEDQVVRKASADPAGAPRMAPGTRIALSDSLCQRVVEGRMPSRVPDTSSEPETAELPLTREAHIGAYVGVPVRFANGRLYGTLCAASREGKEIDDRDLEFVEVLAGLVADTIEREELHDRTLRMEAELTSVRALLTALDARDRYTGEHSQAVVELSVAVACELELDEGAVAAVEQVALLHDIGKLGIPDTILQKPGALDDDEWEVMREHPGI